MAITVTPIPISQLAEADFPLTGDELVVVVQDGVTRRSTSSAVAGASNSAVIWNGTVTQALLPGVTNNLNVDLSEASVLALTLTGDSTLNSIVAPAAAGQMLFIQNLSDTHTLTVPNAGGGTAANQMASNGDMIYPPRCGGLYRYDGTVQRWVKA